MTKNQFLAICPAYNEEGRIGNLLKTTKPKVDEICVVDDGSNDNTREEALAEGVTVLSHNTNKGKGAAIKTGIEYFLKSDHDFVIFIDGDGQHNPGDIEKFRNKFLANPEIDILIASRFGSTQWQQNMPFMRKLSNLLSRFGLWILYNGLFVEDPQNGYRAYRRKVMEHVQFETMGYEAETEIIIDSYLKGFKIDKVPIESIYDPEGNASKFSLLMDTWKIPGVMVRLFFERKPFLLKSKEDQLRYRYAENPPI